MSPPSPHDWALQQHPPTYVGGSLDFTGLDRLVAREHVIEEMKRLGHFEGVEDRKNPDEAQRPLEDPDRAVPERAVVREDGRLGRRPPGLAQSALDAVNDGRVKFFPQRYTKTRTSTGWERSGTGVSAASCGGGTGFRCGVCPAMPRCGFLMDHDLEPEAPRGAIKSGSVGHMTVDMAQKIAAVWSVPDGGSDLHISVCIATETRTLNSRSSKSTDSPKTPMFSTRGSRPLSGRMRRSGGRIRSTTRRSMRKSVRSKSRWHPRLTSGARWGTLFCRPSTRQRAHHLA